MALGEYEKEPYEIAKQETIESLKEKILLYEEDALFSMYFALNRKFNELSNSLNNFVLDIKAEDKSFANFLNLSKGLSDLAATLSNMRNEYLKLTDSDVKEEMRRSLPPLERRAMDGK